MSDPIIKVEALGKRYRLGAGRTAERYTALRDVISDKAKSLFNRKVSLLKPQRSEPISEFWALSDVCFEVQRGEVLGIIGRNGAGKSTLLKILSRITEPTVGCVRIKGRVASLLEVGTGFHPELTGRENIFLNGAILGMHRAEIRRTFDEIVAFAEVEKFLDTPVKRYSSGMYVRLAFAVAAHLEPEILVIDEVLAVGDAEFQKKCLGKMSEVARGGRTVLFVSHNMAAVQSLTSSSIVLSAGRKVFQGPTVGALQCYSAQVARRADQATEIVGRGTHSRIVEIALQSADGGRTDVVASGERFSVRVTVETDGAAGLSLDFLLFDGSGGRVGLASTVFFSGVAIPDAPALHVVDCVFAPLWLASGTYRFDIATAVPNVSFDHYVENALEFAVLSCNPTGLPFDYKQSFGFGSVALPFASRPTITLHERSGKRETANAGTNL